MNSIFKTTIFLAGLLVLVACGGEDANSNNQSTTASSQDKPGNAAASKSPGSETDAANTPSNPGTPQPGQAGTNEGVANQPGEPTGFSTISNQTDFNSRAKNLEQELFGEDFQKIKLKEVDQQPRFPQANQGRFLRLQRIKPIPIKYSPQAYMRITWKAYQFDSQSKARTVLEEWLNGMESSADTIRLGEAVEAVKTPPFMCAVRGNEIYMVQGSCVYKGEVWDRLMEKFNEELKASGAGYRFKASCKAGELTYWD